jgi:hypothetical protein
VTTGLSKCATEAAAAARAVVTEALGHLIDAWDAEGVPPDRRRVALAVTLGFEEAATVDFGSGYRRGGLLILQREHGPAGGTTNWLVVHEPSREVFPHAGFGTPERALAAALALLHAPVDWTRADAWSRGAAMTTDARTVAGLTLRAFVNEEAAAVAKRAADLIHALAELDALVVVGAAGRSEPPAAA